MERAAAAVAVVGASASGRRGCTSSWRGSWSATPGADEDVPHGDGAPVLLVPGFLAGDATLAVMHGWLRRIGHRSYRSEIA